MKYCIPGHQSIGQEARKKFYPKKRDGKFIYLCDTEENLLKNLWEFQIAVLLEISLLFEISFAI